MRSRESVKMLDESLNIYIRGKGGAYRIALAAVVQPKPCGGKCGDGYTFRLCLINVLLPYPWRSSTKHMCQKGGKASIHLFA